MKTMTRMNLTHLPLVFSVFFLVLLVMLFIPMMVPAVHAATTAAAATGTQGGIGAFLSWITDHQEAVGAGLALILDYIFATNPKWKSNGALHFVQLCAQTLRASAGIENPVPAVKKVAKPNASTAADAQDQKADD